MSSRFGQSSQAIAGGHWWHRTQSAALGSDCGSWPLGRVPESVLNRDQYICNQVDFLYAFDVAHQRHQVAFDVSQDSLVGPYIHFVSFLWRPPSTLTCRRLHPALRELTSRGYRHGSRGQIVRKWAGETAQIFHRPRPAFFVGLLVASTSFAR